MFARALLLALLLGLISPVMAMAAPDDTATLSTVDSTSRTRSVPVFKPSQVRAEPFAVTSPPVFPVNGHDAFPTLMRAADGTIWLGVRHGSNHVAARDGVLRVSTSADSGKTFSAPTTFLAESGVDFRDPSFSLIRGEVWTSWFTGSNALAAEGAWVQRGAGMIGRIDNLGYAAIAAPVRELPDGSIGAVYYGHPTPKNLAERDSIWLARSVDGGATWTHSLIADGPSSGRDYQEPWLVVRGNQLIVTHRYGSWDSIGITFSNDLGQTWSPPRKLFGNATGRPNAIVTRTGAMVMNYRAADTRDAMIATSLDGGMNWTTPTVMLDVPADDIGWAYSDILQIDDKTLLVVASVETGDQAGIWRTMITSP
jgi:hypothetical protein